MKRLHNVFAAIAAFAIAASPAFAQKKYDPGATDTTIKIGNTMPYSGPASAYGQIGKAEAAYFRMINDKGGVHGRRIEFISIDDGYSPPKTVEAVRRLVESDQVLALFSTLGTPSNTAIHAYVNAKKIPHLFLATGASKWNDPRHFPWTIGWQPNYETEARTYAAYILHTKPDAKIAILYQNDDYGKDYLKGFKDGLGEKAKQMIVGEATYEVGDPTIESQILQLQGSGADTFFNIATPKFAALAIRKIAEVGWKPLHFLNNVSSSVGSVLKPAGLENSVGLITTQYLKDPTDPAWANDPALKDFVAFMNKYLPGADLSDGNNVFGYTVAQTLVLVLDRCGDNLTRENVMKQATNIKGLQLPMALPGVLINTSPTDYAPFQTMQLARFDGRTWVRFGGIVSDF